MTSEANPVEPQRSALTFRWAVTRALIGVGLITIFVLGEAWLLYAGIDPIEDRANEIQAERAVE